MKHNIWLKALVLIAVILFSFHVSAFTRDNVTGEWHFNETTGDLLPNTAGLFDGNLVNMENADWVSGKMGNALIFDGVAEFVTLGTEAGNVERTDTFSAEFWVKTTSSASEGIISKQLNTGTIRGWNVFIEGGQIKTTFISDNATSNRIFIETDDSFNDGVFHHVAITYDGSSTAAGLNIYVDGVAVAMTTLTDNLSATILNSAETQISGRDGQNFLFTGTVDELVAYDVELTAGDVLASFNNNVGTEFHPPVDEITVNVVDPNGGESFDNFSLSTIDIDFTVQSPDTNLLFIDINFSTTGSQGTGTEIIQDVNTASASITCDDADFTNTTNCTFVWNIDAVADNNYFILIDARDEFNTFKDNDLSDGSFEIFTSVVPNAPTTTVNHPNGSETFNNTSVQFVDINFTVQDDDNNSLLVDLNFSTGPAEGNGTVIINDVNTTGGSITCADADFSNQTLCTFSWDIDAVPDGTFFILNSVTDGSNTNFDASDDSFTILTGGNPPDGNVTVPNGGETFDNASVSAIDINFNVQDPDDNILFIDLNFSTSSSQGTGTPITNGVSTDSPQIVCEDSDFSDSTLCTFSWNINAISDNDYFILLDVSDGDSTTSNAFDSSDTTFEIFTTVSPTAPVVNMVNPNGSETFDKRLISTIDVNFSVIDSDDDTLLIDINFSTSAAQGTGTSIADDVNTTGGSITCTDADFSNVTLCTFTWDISAVTDNDYFLLIKATDGTLTDFDTTFSKFTIEETDDPAAEPTLTGTGLIDGGGFEGTEVNDKWFDAVCGKTASPPISGTINRAGAGGWVADTNLSTEGSLAGFCRFGSAGGLSGLNDSPRVCIIKSDATKKDCTVFTNNAEPFPPEQFLDVEIDLTFDYGSDFNILMFWFETIDRNFFSVAYNGSTELVSGDKLLIDIELCKAGGNNCPTGEVFGAINGYIGIDNVRIAGHLLTVQEPSEPIPSLSSFEITARVQDQNGFNPNADVNFFLEGDTDVMVFSNGFYRFTVAGGLATGDFDFNVISVLDSVTRTVSGTLEVRRQEFQYLTITPIENIQRFEFGSVDFFPADLDEGITWRVDSNSSVAETPTFKIFNSRIDGKQYFIFTSPDGNSFAFDDTLTFGVDETSVIQKIWNESTGLYTHSFEDTLEAGETKFYKLTYRDPYKHFFSIRDSLEWITILQPDVNTTESFVIDEYSISDFSNIRSILIQNVPDVFLDETFAFELQVTAWSDIAGTVLEGGQTVGGADSVTGVILSTEPQRFSFTIDATDFESQALFKTANEISARVFMTDYAIVARGFFTKRLKLRKGNNDPLDVFLLSGLSTRFLQEGTEFRLDTEAYDREGTIDTITIQAFLDGTSTVNNLVKTTVFTIDTDEETIFSFNQLFPAIIDLNGNAETPDPPRTLIVRAKISDINGNVIAIQSRTVTFLQFPYFPNDLIINFLPTEKLLGKHPKGIVQIQIADPNILEALEFRIFSDTNTVTNPNFKTTIFKGQDFNCVGVICSLQVEFDEYIFEDLGLTTITTFAIINTEFFNINNPLTRHDRRIFVTAIEFNTAKIFQVAERIDRTYRNDEEIRLILILQDSEAKSLKSKVDVFITLESCDLATGANCDPQTLEYKPSSFVYDPTINMNYYFFRHLYVLDNGSLLPDGKFIRFKATVTDKSGARTVINPVLTDRCQNQNYLPDFVDIALNPVGLTSYLVSTAGKIVTTALTGCQAGSEQFAVVTRTENNVEEVRLEIDETKTLTSPSQEVFFCLAPDTNNVINKPLEQDIVCAVIYETAEKPIDDFRLIISNTFSDFSVEGSTKQYKQFDIPYELIATSDSQLLKAQLETNTATTIVTVQDFLFHGAKAFAKQNFVSSGLQDVANFTFGSAIIPNVGADFDLTADFNGATVPAVVWFIVKGIPVTNVQDFRNDSRFNDQFEIVDQTHFLDFMALNDIALPENEATLQVFVSNVTSPTVITDPDGSLIINELPIKLNINQNNADPDLDLKYQFIPNVLFFNVQSTMFFNNFSENDTLSVPLKIVVQINDLIQNSLADLFAEFGQDPAGTITDVLFGSIFIIAIIIALIFMYSLIRRNLSGGGNGGGG